VDVVFRQAVGLLVVSASFILVILRLSRTRKLSYRYTVGWLIFGITIALSVIPLFILDSLEGFLGIPRLNIGLLVLGVVVLAIAVELSLSTSHVGTRQRILGLHQTVSSAPATEVNRDPNAVLVVIPALNESRSVADVVSGCRSEGYECLVIDDGSIDDTGEQAARAGAIVLTAPFNLGIGVALRAGFLWAVKNGYNTVVQCDADGQHSTDSIVNLISVRQETNADLVIGSRFAQENDYPVGTLRRLVMRLLARKASQVTKTSISDASSGFRCIHGRLLHEFAKQYPMDYMDSYEALIASGRAGYLVIETFTPMRERAAGVASNNPVRAAFHTLKVVSAGIVGTQITFDQKP